MIKHFQLTNCCLLNHAVEASLVKIGWKVPATKIDVEAHLYICLGLLMRTQTRYIRSLYMNLSYEFNTILIFFIDLDNL